ncbi:MAG: NAD-binding protein [Smithellaceae bacterium]|nr:NAD-binding protein [Smithellaceae bacterium]
MLPGYHRGVRAVVEKMGETAPELLKKIMVIDFNLEVLKELAGRNVKGVFGDISSMDTLDHAHVAKAEIIFSTIPDMLLKKTGNLSLVKTCRTIAPNAVIVATVDSMDRIEELKKKGANEIFLPYAFISESLAWIIFGIYGKNN